MELDILEFRVPVENNKTLLVWDIEPNLSPLQIYDGLSAVFSSFGPLYLLKVSPNAPLSPPGFYALVKFYSAAQAAAAQRGTDGHLLFQTSPLKVTAARAQTLTALPVGTWTGNICVCVCVCVCVCLKVRLSSRQTPHFLSDSCKLLSHGRCLELANHYLGFNGWSSDIITLEELSGGEEEQEEEQDAAARGQWRSLRFGCLLQLSFPRHRCTTRAAGVVEDRFICTGPDVLLHQRCRLQRLARERALVRAFAAVLLVILGDGRVMVEVKQTSDLFPPEHAEQLIQVNELAPDGDGSDSDEELDLTVW